MSWWDVLVGQDVEIGRLGFLQKGQQLTKMQAVSREQLLRARADEGLFDELVQAYLGIGTGIAGMQPKIMVPDRATVPVPNLIVKTGSAAYPGLAANEFLCMNAAKRAGSCATVPTRKQQLQIVLVCLSQHKNPNPFELSPQKCNSIF